MTLEELIEHEENESKATWNGKPTLCAEEHRQLAEWLKDYKRLLAQESCIDAISRQAVLNAMRENHRSGGRDVDGDYIEGDYRESLYDDIISLPSVTPSEKVGKWIGVNPMVDTLMCSECGENIISEEFKSNYCPYCGSRML